MLEKGFLKYSMLRERRGDVLYKSIYMCERYIFMKLADLTQYTEKFCEKEKPLIYICSYTGRDLSEDEGVAPTRKERPMRLITGLLFGVNTFSEELSIKDVQIVLDSPYISLDFAQGIVSWDTAAFIDNLREEDIVETNRQIYEEGVREHLKKWEGATDGEFMYERNANLLRPYFLLVDELQRQRESLVGKIC